MLFLLFSVFHIASWRIKSVAFAVAQASHVNDFDLRASVLHVRRVSQAQWNSAWHLGLVLLHSEFGPQVLW